MNIVPPPPREFFRRKCTSFSERNYRLNPHIINLRSLTCNIDFVYRRKNPLHLPFEIREKKTKYFWLQNPYKEAPRSCMPDTTVIGCDQYGWLRHKTNQGWFVIFQQNFSQKHESFIGLLTEHVAHVWRETRFFCKREKSNFTTSPDVNNALKVSNCQFHSTDILTI